MKKFIKEFMKFKEILESDYYRECNLKLSDFEMIELFKIYKKERKVGEK